MTTWVPVHNGDTNNGTPMGGRAIYQLMRDATWKVRLLIILGWALRITERDKD